MPKQKLKKMKPPKRTLAAREVSGTLHGYAATWEVDEHYHTQFMPGCWAKSIQERIASVPIMIKHIKDGADVMEEVGILKGAHEDDIGLSVSGGFLTDALSEHVRTKVKAGAPRGLSVGFEIINSQVVDGIEQITEARLAEVTITNNPSDRNAKILDARTAEPDALSEKRAADTQRREAEFVRLGLELDLLEILL